MENPNDCDDQLGQGSDETNEDAVVIDSKEEKFLCNENGNGPELSEERLLQLKNNDPSANSMFALWKEDGYVNDVDWEEEGGHLGDNKHMKKAIVEVRDTSYHANGYQIVGSARAKFVAFCRGLSRNRSIRALHVVDCVPMILLMETLRPFFEENSNLSHLVMDGCNMDTEAARLLVLALSN